MKISGTLVGVVMGWPVDAELKTGHRAVFASKSAPEGVHMQPVVSWGIVEGERNARTCVPLVWDAPDACLMPATEFSNYCGLLEPGDDIELLKDAVAAKLAETAESDPPASGDK